MSYRTEKNFISLALFFNTHREAIMETVEEMAKAIFIKSVEHGLSNIPESRKDEMIRKIIDEGLKGTNIGVEMNLVLTATAFIAATAIYTIFNETNARNATEWLQAYHRFVDFLVADMVQGNGED